MPPRKRKRKRAEFFSVASRHFASRKEARAHARALLSKYNRSLVPNAPKMSRDDFQMLTQLYGTHHPQYQRLRAGRGNLVSLQCNVNKSPSLLMTFENNTTVELRESLLFTRKDPHEQNVLAAFRAAIEPLMREYLKEFKGPLVCAATKVRMEKKAQCVVVHSRRLPFLKILGKWFDKWQVDWSLMPVKQVLGFMYELDDEDFAADWLEHHKQHAKLEIVCRAEAEKRKKESVVY